MSDKLNNGKRVRAVFEDGKIFSELEIIRLGMDICSELDMSAQTNAPHADISAENVYVYENGIYTLIGGECSFDASRDIRALGLMMYRFLGGEEADSEEIFGDVVTGFSSELAQIIKKAVFPQSEGAYTELSQIKKDLMSIYAKKCFEGVSVSAEAAPPVDETAAIRRDVREMKKNAARNNEAQNSDLEATLIADALTDAYTTEYVLDDADESEDSDAYRVAIEAGASVTAAAKILHGQDIGKINKKRKAYTDDVYSNSKKRTTIAILIAVAVCILAIIVAIPIIGHALGEHDDTDTTTADSGTASGAVVTGIEIECLPIKLSYSIGDIVETDGLVLAVKYESGDVRNIAGGYTVTPSVITESGEQEITISYGEFSAVYNIEAYSDSVESITILSLPECTEYELGQDIDLTGIKVEVFYSDGLSDEFQSGFTCTPMKAEAIGEQDITISYKGKEAIFKITVKEATLKEIEVRTLPKKTTYEVGEYLSTSGLTLTARYTNESKPIYSGYTCTPTVFSEVGTQKVTVTYEGQTAEFDVTVIEVDSIDISSLPGKTEYELGETLNTSGLSLRVKYSDGTEKTVTNGFTCTPSTLNKAGNVKVTVSYRGKNAEFTVTVKEVASIEISSLPSKTEYELGEALDTSGLSLRVKYSDGTEKTVTGGFTYTPSTLDKAGSVKVTVTYNGKTAEFFVTVNAAQVSGVTEISIKTMPHTTSYRVGEALLTDGLSILVKYSDGTQNTVTDGYICLPTVFSEAGIQKVTVTYGGQSAEFEVRVFDDNVSQEVLSGNCGSSVKWTLSGYVLTISGNGEMDNFEEHGAPWEAYIGQIDKIIVSDDVLSIGTFAFAHTSVKSVSIGESVRIIGDGAFYDCKNLINISVSDSNKFFTDVKGGALLKDSTTLIAYSIGRAATTFILPRSVTTIGGYRVFYGSNLREIVIPQALYSVDTTAFVGASKLEKFTIGAAKAGLEVKDGVLYTKNFNALICYPAAKAQSSFTVPDGVGVIRENAFADNTNLVELTLPTSLYRVDANAFVNVGNLIRVKYSGDEKAFAKVQINEGNEAITNAAITFETVG